MAYINKENFLESLEEFFNSGDIDFFENDLAKIYDFVYSYEEADCIELDVDYWLPFYDILTKPWSMPGNSNEAVQSFKVSRKKFDNSTSLKEGDE